MVRTILTAKNQATSASTSNQSTIQLPLTTMDAFCKLENDVRTNKELKDDLVMKNKILLHV